MTRTLWRGSIRPAKTIRRNWNRSILRSTAIAPSDYHTATVEWCQGNNPQDSRSQTRTFAPHITVAVHKNNRLNSWFCELGPEITYYNAPNLLSTELIFFFRTQLTILHHNENSMRSVQTNKDGSIRYRIVRKKVTKLLPTLATKRVKATYG